MKKHIIFIAIAALFLLLFCGCSSQTGSENDIFPQENIAAAVENASVRTSVKQLNAPVLEIMSSMRAATQQEEAKPAEPAETEERRSSPQDDRDEDYPVIYGPDYEAQLEQETQQSSNAATHRPSASGGSSSNRPSSGGSGSSSSEGNAGASGNSGNTSGGSSAETSKPSGGGAGGVNETPTIPLG